MLKDPLGSSEESKLRQRDAERHWAAMPANAREVLGQLFLNGPLWDGYVASKAGRDWLNEYELIERGFGWQWLTRDGVEAALCANAQDWFDGRWRKKQNGS